MPCGCRAGLLRRAGERGESTVAVVSEEPQPADLRLEVVRREVAVNLRGEARVAVAQHPLDHCHRHTRLKQQRSAGVPEVVKPEVLFLVPTEGRRTSTDAALARFASTKVNFRVSTLEKAVADLQGLLPRLAGLPMPLPTPVTDRPLLGSEDHRTVSTFVVESTTALAQANAALRQHGISELVEPPSAERMLDFLKRAQAARCLRSTKLFPLSVEGGQLRASVRTACQ